MVLFNTIDIYTAIMLYWLSVACVAQWVEHVNIAHLYIFKLCVVSSNPRVGSHVVSDRIHCTEKWRTSFHTDVLSKSK